MQSIGRASLKLPEAVGLSVGEYNKTMLSDQPIRRAAASLFGLHAQAGSTSSTAVEEIDLKSFVALADPVYIVRGQHWRIKWLRAL